MFKWRDAFILMGLVLVLYRPAIQMLPQKTPGPSPEHSASVQVIKALPSVASNQISSSPVNPKEKQIFQNQLEKDLKPEELERLLQYFKLSEIRYFEPPQGFSPLYLYTQSLEKTKNGVNAGIIRFSSEKPTHSYDMPEVFSIETYKTDTPMPDAYSKEGANIECRDTSNTDLSIIKVYVPLVKQKIEFCKGVERIKVTDNGNIKKHTHYSFNQIRRHYMPDRLSSFSIFVTTASPKQFEDFLKRIK